MSVIIYIAVIVLISISIYSLVICDGRTDRKRTSQILALGREEVKDYRLLEVVQKIPFSKSKKQLDQLGNPFPFRLNPISYMIAKLVMAAVAFISIMQRFNSIFLGIIAIPLGFFSIDYLQHRSNKNDLDLIRLDFADIDNILILKKKTGVVIGKALIEVYNAARNSKRLREALLIMAARINFTGRIDEALQEFQDRFNFTETSDFVKCIKSSLDTGLIEEELEGHARSINRDKKLYMRKKIRSIDSIIMISGLLILFGVVGLVFATILPEVGSRVNSIFR